MARKLARINFRIFGPPPRNFFAKNEKKIKVVPNWLKWRKNWSDIIFGFFDPPQKKYAKNQKIKVVPNLSEMTRKLFGNYFRMFLHHPPPPRPQGVLNQRKKTSIKNALKERQPQMKANSMEDDLNHRQPQ